MKPWVVTRSRVLIERRWLKLREDRVSLPWGGEIPEFHVIESPAWSSVVPFTEDGRLVLVEQYRHGIEKVTLELPAGVIDAGETPLQAAQRELLEESGYSAAEWEPLIELCPDPNRQNARAHFFLARGARAVRDPKLDDSEQIEVVLVTPAELWAAIDAGRFCQGVQLGALLIAARKGALELG
jgi:8-oxo-dGTP pyrophosphatase MutT (NUDIX family)